MGGASTGSVAAGVPASPSTGPCHIGKIGLPSLERGHQ